MNREQVGPVLRFASREICKANKNQRARKELSHPVGSSAQAWLKAPVWQITVVDAELKTLVRKLSPQVFWPLSVGRVLGCLVPLLCVILQAGFCHCVLTALLGTNIYIKKDIFYPKISGYFCLVYPCSKQDAVV